MSVTVTIDIAQGAAHRWMTIACTSEPKLDQGGHRDIDEINTYQVVSGNQPIERTQRMRVATFEHRYGDDVTILIAKAGEALREKYGNV